MKNICITLILFFLSTSGYCQLTDLFRTEYTYFPQKKSKNSFKRFRALIATPIKLNDKGAFLVPGLEFKNVNFDFNDLANFETKDLDKFVSWDLTLGYTFKINDQWRFAARSGVLIASNFENNTIKNDDLLYSGAAFMIKDKTGEGKAKKPWRLILGLQFSTSAGIPFPLPIVNYHKRFHPSWSYGLGAPKSNLKYYLGKKNTFQTFATLDGFFANIQNNRNIASPDGSQTKIASSISFTVALAGIGYERKLSKHWVFYTLGGYTFLNDIRLRDDNRDDVFSINKENTFYIRGGIKFKL